MIQRKMQRIGVVGLGLMGSSIIVSFLKAGYAVIAVTPLLEELEIGTQRIHEQLRLCDTMGLLDYPIAAYAQYLQISSTYADLVGCDLVVECVIEIESIKKTVYANIEEAVGDYVLIATNTSAMPISQLQSHLRFPRRFMGIHWAEPAYATRFLEITCGVQTETHLAEIVQQEAEHWSKEPTLLYKDIRGFITNRLMYAVYREGFHLINSNVANMEALDKSFHYGVGSWISLMGIFKRMDYIGLQHYLESYNTIFPKLSTTTEVPPQMQHIADVEGRGIHNLKGLYPHTAESAAELERSFATFNEEIFRLVEIYRSKKKHLKL